MPSLTMRLLGLLLLAGTAGAAEPGFPAAVQFADIDADKSRLIVDDVAAPADPGMLRTLLNLPGAPKQDRGAARNSKSKWTLVLAFREPVAIGTQMLMSTGRNAPVASVLRADADPATAKDADWTAIPSLHVFPHGIKVRALRLAGTGSQPDTQQLRWLLAAPRFTSLTTEAVGSGEKGPFGSHPNAIPTGHKWVNAGPDPSPNAPKTVPRGSVSEVFPSWYILSWDAPRTLHGLWLTSNAEQFTISVYRGDPKQNPALATPRDWEKLPSIAFTGLTTDGLVDRFLPLPSIAALAIKVEITAVRKGGPVAEIHRFEALTDLGDRPAPTRTGPSLFPIPYQQPFDGTIAMVITDVAGKPIRNLVAQVDRKQGPNLELWDLKDDAGRTVPPGEYRWKAITAPPIGLEFQFAVAPNVPADRVPWQTAESGPDGWLADHSAPSSGTTWGDRVYFGAPVAESGVSLIECDLDGKKQWAKHGFGPFIGVTRLAADQGAVYVLSKDSLERLDPASHTFKPLGKVSRDERAGQVVGMTAAADKLYLALQAPVPFLDNALRSTEVDLANCWPTYPEKIPDISGTRRVAPNPRMEFLRLLRLTGTPSGQQEPKKDREPLFPIDLETSGDSRSQFILVAFKSPVPVGSILFPCPGPEYRVELYALKPTAAYPPNPKDESTWVSFPTQPSGGWTCVAAPPQTRTRAVRLKVTRAGDAPPDPLDDILSPTKKDPPGLDNAGGGKPSLKAMPEKDWFVRIEGMRLLRRRLAPLTAGLSVKVNSGTVNAQGVWDAKRTEPVTSDKPGVYVMEWPTAQKVAGLAIKEIDGAETEIDVWDGPAGSRVSLDDPANWKTVATYVQSRRDSYEPAFNRNDCARYLDGMVEFGEEVSTRAVRLRVVKQWADNSLGNGNRQTASLRRDRGGRNLDPRRCILYGVMALRCLGDEPEVDRLAYQRIEIRDGKTGAVLKEFPAAVDRDLAVSPDGVLYAIHANRVVRIDASTGAATPVLPAIDGVAVSASRLAVGPDNLLYVFVKPDSVVRAFRPTGELVRTFGKPGGQKPGPWDPEKFLSAHVLVPDSRGGLWVVENQNVPRRIVHFNADGSVAREHFGNTPYGGGGVLDRFDRSRLFHANTQFEIDWQTGKTRIKNLLAERMPEHLVPVRLGERTYLASAPLSYSTTQPVAQVYLLDEAAGTAKPVAAFGDAGQFTPLKTSAMLAVLAPGKVPADYTFLWADRNGNGQPDPDEVALDLKSDKSRTQLGRFNEACQCRGGDELFEVKEVLPNGTPVFVRSRVPASGLYGLQNGRVLDMNVPVPGSHVRHSNSGGRGGHNETLVRDSAGARVWSYPTEHPSVSGLWLPPWEAGYVSNEFGVIGHETEARGDLGEFFVTSANNGQWKIWTADGLLAGNILRHKFDRQSRLVNSFSDAARGTRLDNLSAGQEHFHGFFTKTDADGRYYIVHGHNFIGLTEVLGLDRFQRLGASFTVTADDARRVHEAEVELARREVKSQARVIECGPLASLGAKDVTTIEGAKFAIAHDGQVLFLRWTLEDALQNSGTDFHRYFKTGACVEVQLGTDPVADPLRRSPTRGDLRLLITAIDGKPEVVLYQPVAPGASATERWETRTDAAGTTAFDRVVRLTDARVVLKALDSGGCTIEAAVPLQTLGVRMAPGTRLGFDWGVQTSDDGRSVKRRQYWSNRLATGTADEAAEARLEPHLWGSLVFTERSAADRKLNEALPGIEGSGKPSNDVDDLLRSIDKKKP